MDATLEPLNVCEQAEAAMKCWRSGRPWPFRIPLYRVTHYGHSRSPAHDDFLSIEVKPPPAWGSSSPYADAACRAHLRWEIEVAWQEVANTLHLQERRAPHGHSRA
jgi:hypothetical protein